MRRKLTITNFFSTIGKLRSLYGAPKITLFLGVPYHMFLLILCLHMLYFSHYINVHIELGMGRAGMSHFSSPRASSYSGMYLKWDKTIMSCKVSRKRAHAEPSPLLIIYVGPICTVSYVSLIIFTLGLKSV